MKITALSILFCSVAILSVSRIIVNIKRESIGIRSAILWLILWTGVGFFALFPDVLDTAVAIAQMENRMLFILLLSLFVLFAIVSDLASRLDKIQRDLATLVREISLTNYRIENLPTGKGKTAQRHQ